MELKEAIATARGLGNIFAGFRKIEDVLAAAEQADNLAGERQQLINAKTADLATITQQVNDAQVAETSRSAAAEQAHALRLKEQDAQFDAAALAFTSVKSRLDTDLAAAEASHAEQTTKLLDEIRELTVTRDDTAAALSTLQAQLAQLKDRAASL